MSAGKRFSSKHTSWFPGQLKHSGWILCVFDQKHVTVSTSILFFKWTVFNRELQVFCKPSWHPLPTSPPCPSLPHHPLTPNKPAKQGGCWESEGSLPSHAKHCTKYFLSCQRTSTSECLTRTLSLPETLGRTLAHHPQKMSLRSGSLVRPWAWHSPCFDHGSLSRDPPHPHPVSHHSPSPYSPNNPTGNSSIASSAF